MIHPPHLVNAPLRMVENVAIAVGALRANKLRSGLTILGVVIGVATVMAMAAIVEGIRDQIVHTIEVAGPTTFYVLKILSQTPLNPDRLPRYVRVRPNLTIAEAERLRMLPTIAYASLWAQVAARLERGAVHTQPAAIMGADERYIDIQGGELTLGRWFTRGELTGGAAVIVLDGDFARRLFGYENPLDGIVRVGGRPARVVGVYEPAANIFQPPGQAIAGIVPYLLLDRQFTIDRTNATWIPIKPRIGISLAAAQEVVTVALREMRRLRPGDKNTFDLVTQDQILDTFDKLTGAFFLVMIVLSAIALLVGGIGVMAIMMVSVTSRTREIGLRKAVGATRADIRGQFLVEAATLTGVGGVLGIAVGLALGKAVTLALRVDAAPPITETFVAVIVSVGIGIAFGLIPAVRAARLDPVEALRHE
ncbi:MAG: ABC transporter permease [Gemmatimonadaceae bacterium]